MSGKRNTILTDQKSGFIGINKNKQTFVYKSSTQKHCLKMIILINKSMLYLLKRINERKIMAKLQTLLKQHQSATKILYVRVFMERQRS